MYAYHNLYEAYRNPGTGRHRCPGTGRHTRAPNRKVAPSYFGSPEVAELLLSRGADKSKRSDYGNTALQWAQKRKSKALAALLA